MDCRKDYNLMSWSWISRCLRAARLPEFLYTIIMTMLQTEARLVLQGLKNAGVASLLDLHKDSHFLVLFTSFALTRC